MPTVNLNGINLAYDDVGQGEPIIFIHGIFVSRTAWQPQVNYFARTHRVITLDLRGHGESPATDTPYSVELFATDVAALLDKLGLKQVICCGHSFGGMVAQELALSYPERVSHLILAESSYGVSTTPWEAAMVSATDMAMAMISPAQQVKLVAALFGSFNPEIVTYVESQGAQQLKNPANFQKIYQASLDFNSRWRLHRLTCPTLILLGQYFQVPWIHFHSYEMLWSIKQSKLRYIPQAGHVLHWDNPAAFNQTMAGFLA
jgi:pimeloyl-ACP methyl ester carboxylesterase